VLCSFLDLPKSDGKTMKTKIRIFGLVCIISVSSLAASSALARRGTLADIMAVMGAAKGQMALCSARR
jgi:hypothetical protein